MSTLNTTGKLPRTSHRDPDSASETRRTAAVLLQQTQQSSERKEALLRLKESSGKSGTEFCVGNRRVGKAGNEPFINGCVKDAKFRQ